MCKVLIVDDDASILKVLSSVLQRQGYVTCCAETGEEAIEILENDPFDLLITDLRLGIGMDGVELLHRSHLIRRRLTAIMITGYGTVDVAVQAMKEGAFDFITKPFKMGTLLETVENAVKHLRVPVPKSGTDAEIKRHFGSVVGESAAMHEVYRLIERVGRTDATVLIQGESGTGKELVAKAIHTCSARSKGPYVPLNCAALSPALLESEMFGHVAGAFTGATKTREGLFVAANHGTLLLDEIQSMEVGIQGKLLRALQEHKIRRVGDNRDVPVDVRVLASCNVSLEKQRDEGLFREDLYYRISVIPINLPSLRRRSEDIPLLVRHFSILESQKLQMELVIEDDAMEALTAYSWPGNVRELQNAIACAATLCHDGVITEHDLPPNIRGVASEAARPAEDGASPRNVQAQSLRDFLRNKEQEYLELILRRTDGNRAKAAALLGISRATLYRKLPES